MKESKKLNKKDRNIYYGNYVALKNKLGIKKKFFESYLKSDYAAKVILNKLN